MAKKKQNRQGQAQEPNRIPIQQSEQIDQEQPKAAMDDHEEKLQSLKTLNARLVKETHESRKEVESLIKVKEALEVDLEKIRNEKEKLLSKFAEANEGIFGLDLERSVVNTFVQARMDETGVEFRGLIEEKADRETEIGLLKEVIKNVENERDQLRKVGSERDEMKTAFDDLVVEATELKGKLVEMVKNERNVLEEVENLKVQCKELMAEKAENEIEKGVLLKEKELGKRMFDESVGEIEKLKSKVDEIANEKMGIEEEKNGLELKIEKLERKVVHLNESEFFSRKEKKESAGRIFDLEKRIGEAMEKENAIKIEVDNLVKQLHKKEDDIEMLTQQRDLLQLKLDSVQDESKDLLHKMEEFKQEKIDIEEAKVKAESIIVDLQKESSELKNAITSLTEFSKVDKVKNEELVSEISRLGDALVRVELERDDAKKCYSDEKKSVENLSLLLTDKEKKIEEAMGELGKLKMAQDDSLKLKEAMERRIEILIEERDSMERNLLESQAKIDDMIGEMKSLVTNSEQAFALLKSTSLVVCDNEEKGGEMETLELNLAEEIQPYVEQLDAIKTSFKNKEKTVEEMKQLLEVAQAKGREKTSFFTMVTAATTVLAAALSAVYVSTSRGH